MRYKKRTQGFEKDTNTLSTDTAEIEKGKKDLFEFLETAVISKQKNQVLKKLKDTVEMRRLFLTETFSNTLNIYLTHPQLVNIFMHVLHIHEIDHCFVIHIFSAGLR